MQIVQFNSETDKDVMYQLLILRGLEPSWAEDLPAVGWLVRADNGDIIGAGFIRMMEGNHGLLDSFITNPKISGPERDEAMDMITNALLNYAKTQEIGSLLIITQDVFTQLRAQRHDFKSSTFAVLAKSLKE